MYKVLANGKALVGGDDVVSQGLNISHIYYTACPTSLIS